MSAMRGISRTLFGLILLSAGTPLGCGLAGEPPSVLVLPEIKAVVRSGTNIVATLPRIGIIKTGDTFDFTNQAGEYVLRLLGHDTNGLNCAVVSFKPYAQPEQPPVETNQPPPPPPPPPGKIIEPKETNVPALRDPFTPVPVPSNPPPKTIML
jgi:hypothetical protein